MRYVVLVAMGLALVAGCLQAAPYYIGINTGWAANVSEKARTEWAFQTGAEMPRAGARLDFTLKWGPAYSDKLIQRFCQANRHPLIFFTGERVERPLPGGKSEQALVPPATMYEPVFSNGTDEPTPGCKVNPGNAWAYFVWQTVERYDGDGVDDCPGSPKVEYFSVWNEPDYLPWPKRPTSPDQTDLLNWRGRKLSEFARLLYVSYQAAKFANPECKIGPQVCFPETLGYLLDDKTYPAARYLDFVDFHAYASPGSDTLLEAEPGGVLSIARALKAEFTRRKLKPVPLLCSESGYPGTDATAQLVQRAAAAKVQVAGAGEGLVAVCWYGLFDPCWQNMGLLGDVSKLPASGKGARFKDAFYAMRTASELLKGLADGRLQAAGRLALPPEARGYLFKDRTGHPLYVVWAADLKGEPDQQAEVELDLPAGDYAVYHWDFCLKGKPAVLFHWEGGKRTFEVGIDPVYLQHYESRPLEVAPFTE